MRLILIRHGESKDQIAGRGTGPAFCAGLSNQGFAQVRLLAERLRTTRELDDCQTLLSSPTLRAQQTAGILFDVLPAARMAEDDALCEIHLGEGEGLTSKAYREKYGRKTAPGGESWEAFIRRIASTLKKYVTEYSGQTVVAVSHGGFIANSVISLFEIPLTQTRAWLDPDNTGLTEWRSADGRWTLVRYNDTHHLTAGIDHV